MQVLAHPDPFVLEDELLSRIAADKRADPLSRQLVLVPTARLAAHVRRRIAERLSGCLGVEVLHHRAAALAILDAHPQEPPRRFASTAILESLLRRVLEEIPENLWAGFVAERPTALSALLGTLQELREAGIPAEALARHLAGEREQAMREVYERYVAALGRARKRGLVDRADVMGDATAHATVFASRFGAVLHHGAYELIGAHLELLRALDRATETVFLLPCEPGAPVFARAEQFALRYLLGKGRSIERIPDRSGGLVGARLASLYDEKGAPDPVPAGSIRLRHAQGALAEVQVAARSALSSTEQGVAPEEIAVIARGLTPYAVALETVFEEEPRLPWTSSLATPLRREPEVRDLLLLLRAVAEDFPRATTAELLRSRHLDWKGILPGDPPRGDLAESFSRRAGIVSGLYEWTHELREWAKTPATNSDEDDSEEERERATRRVSRRQRHAEGIARAVEALSRRAGRGAPSRWTQHATRVRKLVLGMCRPAEREQSRALRALLDRIDDMADLEVLLDDRRDVPFSEMVEWLERAATSGSPAPGAIDDGGIRVLDAMQARGLTFRSVALLGFHSGLWPRIAHEDPFLPDPARAALREATGAPLEGKAEGEAEERLLLAMLLGSAKDSIDVSWQRADEAGRSKSPSLALREVSRLVLGRPDLEALLASARRLSSHPARAVEDLLDATGLLGPDEEMLLLASRGGTEAEKALLERDGALGPAIAMLLATEAFAAGDGGFDGRVGAGSPLPALSVTAIERLGRCPLQFFFRHRLGVYPIEEEAGVFDLGVNEWGNLIHGVLDRTYRSIASEGVLSGDEPKVLERADSLLLDAWREVFGDVGKRLGRRFPVLWRVAVERYREALRAFVREDLLRIRTEGATLQGCEDRRTGVLDLGDGVLLSLEGRLDRVIEVAGVPWIGDYKTSGKLRPRGDRTKMLKGQWLQAPLYWMLGGETGVVELLGVGPDHEPGTGFDVGDRRVPFFGFGEGEGRAGFVETVRELVGLAQEGRFPLHDDWQCRFCDYRRACRRSHPPTMNREASWEDSAAFRDLQRKSMKVPTLALVRAQRVQEDEEEGFS